MKLVSVFFPLPLLDKRWHTLIPCHSLAEAVGCLISGILNSHEFFIKEFKSALVCFPLSPSPACYCSFTMFFKVRSEHGAWCCIGSLHASVKDITGFLSEGTQEHRRKVEWGKAPSKLFEEGWIAGH